MLKEEDNLVLLLSKILDTPISNLKIRELITYLLSLYKLFF